MSSRRTRAAATALAQLALAAIVATAVAGCYPGRRVMAAAGPAPGAVAGADGRAQASALR